MNIFGIRIHGSKIHELMCGELALDYDSLFPHGGVLPPPILTWEFLYAVPDTSTGDIVLYYHHPDAEPNVMGGHYPTTAPWFEEPPVPDGIE